MGLQPVVDALVYGIGGWGGCGGVGRGVTMCPEPLVDGARPLGLPLPPKHVWHSHPSGDRLPGWGGGVH